MVISLWYATYTVPWFGFVILPSSLQDDSSTHMCNPTHIILLLSVPVWSKLQHCNLGPFHTAIWPSFWATFNVDCIYLGGLTIDCWLSTVYGSDTPLHRVYMTFIRPGKFDSQFIVQQLEILHAGSRPFTIIHYYKEWIFKSTFALCCWIKS